MGKSILTTSGKPLTLQQDAFLKALAGEAKGDPILAKDLAGYAPTTTIVDILRPIKHLIVEYAREALEVNSLKATFGVLSVIDDPSQTGAANKLKASTEVLDRVGIKPPEEDKANAPKGAVFILPPKNISKIEVINGNVTIDMEGDIKEIEGDVNEDDSVPDEEP